MMHNLFATRLSLLFRAGDDGYSISANGRFAAAEPADDGADERWVLSLSSLIAGSMHSCACHAFPSSYKCGRLLKSFWVVADCMEHYMESGLTICLTTRHGKPEALPRDRDEQMMAVGGCIVRIVLKNTIKFPIENAVLTLQCRTLQEKSESAAAAPLDCFSVLPM